MTQARRLIVFDIDGTLLNSVNFNVCNLNRALKVFKMDYRVTEEKVRAHLGCTAEDYYRGVLDDSTYPMWQEIREDARAHMEEMMMAHGEAFEGVRETFDKLHQQGVKLVLYSNCSRPYLEAAIKLIGIEDYLSYTECVKDHGLQKPELLKKILGKYEGYEAIVVGDRIHDIEAAHANGIPCVGAMYGFGQRELDDADYVIHHIGELLALIAK